MLAPRALGTASTSPSRAMALGLALAAAACSSGPRKDEPGGGPPAPLQPSQPQPQPQPQPNPFGMLGAMLATRSDEPGPYDEPRHSPGFADGKPHAAVIELDQPLVELRSFSLLGGAGGLELRTVTDALHRLARDRNVTALVIRFGSDSIDLSAAEELRAAVAGFRRAEPAGREVHCHADGADGSNYFAMTACDTIGLATGGNIVIAGAAAVPIHLKGALDRLGIQADFLHVGAFKGAAEPLTRDRPSPEMIQTLGAILDQRYAALADGIAEGRHLQPAHVHNLIDTAVFTDAEAGPAGLIDQVGGFDAYRDKMLDGAEWTRVDLDPDGAPGIGQLMQLLGAAPVARPTAPHVALVYAVGNVVDGEAGGAAAARREIAPRVLGPALRALTADDSVKAVVLRIDSGGGSALASESLWQDVSALRKKKPVVVSMGGVAASGGYYLACAANQIFASATTLTGSIGVVGGKLAIGQALGKLGIAGFPMGRGKRALMWSALSRWTADERAAVQKLMEGVYSAFVARVAEGRHKTAADLQPIAQGRVWTGAAAVERGLVDKLGGLDDALAAARGLAKLDESAPLEVYPPPPTLADLIGGLGGGSLPFGLDRAAADAAAALAPREAAAVLAAYRQLAGFTTTRVQTALVWPVIFR